VTIERLGLTGETTSVLAWPNRFRFDSAVGPQVERVAFDGAELRHGTTSRPVTLVTGERAEALRIDQPFAHFGDLRRWHAELQVIERLDKNGEEIFLLRTGDTSGPATTLYVHWGTGRVLMVDSITFVDGLGRMGQRQKFDNWREVSGMTLPHRTVIELPNPLIGTIVTTVDDVEVGVEVADDTFRLED
jgi:hypothetical protein